MFTVPRVVLCAAAVALIVGAAAALLLLRDRHETVANVSRSEALKAAGSAPKDEGDITADGRGPRTGGYDYIGGGNEQVHALGTIKRTLPQRTAAVVTAGTGCAWQTNLMLGPDHREGADLCMDAQGSLSMEGYEHEVSAFGGGLLEKLRCDRPVVFSGPNANKQGLIQCSEPEYVTAHLRVVESTPELVLIDGQRIRATRIKLDISYTGETRGTETVTRWFASDGMLLRIRGEGTITADLGMTATFSGHYDYSLAHVPDTAR